MNSYRQIEDLLSSKSFKDWVLKGDSSQQAFWENWQLEHPDKVGMLLQAKTILLEFDSPGQKWQDQRQDFLFSKITGRINFKDKNDKKRSYPIYEPYCSTIEKRVRLSMVAFLVTAILIGFIPNFLTEVDENPLAQEEKEEEWIIKSNPKGQKSIFQLSDGSKVILNAESELRYRNDFGQGQRDIYLHGEAFFEVAKDSLLPFNVFSGDLVTTALGTSFNINSYTEGKVKVQLATGRVKVVQETKDDQPVYLVPGEEVRMGADHTLNKGKFDLNKAFHWKDGILLFERTPFQEAVLAMERWYAVEIDVGNIPQKDLKISGEFKNIHLNDVLESLGYAYGFYYSIENKKVLINFNPPHVNR